MTSAQKERLILRLENLYDSMGNTVDILVSHRDEIPEVDQWVDDLESDMGILTEWINFLRDYNN